MTTRRASGIIIESNIYRPALGLTEELRPSPPKKKKNENKNEKKTPTK